MALAVASAWWATHGREPRWIRHRALPWASWAAALVAFWVVAAQLDLSKNPAPFDFSGGQQLGQQLCYTLVGFFLVVPAALAPLSPSGVRSFLAWGPIAWLGVISYGIYLWHVALLDVFLVWDDTPLNVFAVPELSTGRALAMLVFALVGTIAVAAASWYFVERPILGLKQRHPRDPAAAPAA
jgi:peptidoglycan/LPS O-acetylase OafA/YrhL